MLILKSASPRRKEFLELLGLNFEIEPSQINEDQNENENPLTYLERVTLAKLGYPIWESNFYVSSDTIVVFENKVYPKPLSLEEGFSYLSDLNGKTHQVFSGLGIVYEGKTYFEYDTTNVTMKNLKPEEVWEYLDNNKPLDKAGAYGIQDPNSPVANFQGSYSNVMGFPLRKFFLFYEKWYPFLTKHSSGLNI
jgi:septum formation protein